MRLIDADAAVNEIDDVFSVNDGMALIPTGITKALVKSLLTLEAITPTVGGWISVEDRLPEEHECANEDGEWLESDYVLTFVSNSLPYYPRFYIGQTVDGVWDLEGSDFLEDSDHVTHWMPLPKPPEAPHDAP